LRIPAEIPGMIKPHIAEILRGAAGGGMMIHSAEDRKPSPSPTQAADKLGLLTRRRPVKNKPMSLSGKKIFPIYDRIRQILESGPHGLVGGRGLSTRPRFYPTG